MPHIYKALQKAVDLLKENKTSQEVKTFVEQYFKALSNFELEYFEIADFETLQPINELQTGKTALCIAAFMGKTRLIDNVIV
jgi:pantoate--beta-alanine ligase